MITLENLEDVFTYHEWSPEQRACGNALRAAAKELCRGILERQPYDTLIEDHEVFCQAIRDSAIVPPAEKTELYAYAQNRRQRALKCAIDIFPSLKYLEHEEAQQNFMSSVNEIVMIANSAITFEAAQLVKA